MLWFHSLFSYELIPRRSYQLTVHFPLRSGRHHLFPSASEMLQIVWTFPHVVNAERVNFPNVHHFAQVFTMMFCLTWSESDNPYVTKSHLQNGINMQIFFVVSNMIRCCLAIWKNKVHTDRESSMLRKSRNSKETRSRNGMDCRRSVLAPTVHLCSPLEWYPAQRAGQGGGSPSCDSFWGFMSHHHSWDNTFGYWELLSLGFSLGKVQRSCFTLVF